MSGRKVRIIVVGAPPGKETRETGAVTLVRRSVNLSSTEAQSTKPVSNPSVNAVPKLRRSLEISSVFGSN